VFTSITLCNRRFKLSPTCGEVAPNYCKRYKPKIMKSYVLGLIGLALFIIAVFHIDDFFLACITSFTGCYLMAVCYTGMIK
jgi:hypothetical protein